MKIIESALEPIIEYFVSITNNTVEGKLEMEIGIPKGWVFNENKEIKCEVLAENEAGKLIKITPKNNKVVIDDLVSFVEIIIETNRKIAEKEKEFTSKMEEMKGVLEKEAKKFYEELDELKENSFKNLNATFEKNLRGEDIKNETRGRKKKIGDIIATVSGLTGTHVEPAIKIDTSRNA